MVYPTSYTPRLAAFAVLLLVGCTDVGTQCAGREIRELRTIDQLIDETRADMARGYRYETQDTDARINLCLGGARSNVGVSFCTDPGRRREAVALDTVAETRKLDALLARRTALLTTIAERQAACTR
ncbi:MAG: hypothetical protein WBA90_12680 [Albidovulum sp.]